MNRPASPIDLGPSSSKSRYEMLATIASGGMATVYVGRLRGAGGFSRTVAVKRAHPHLLTDPTYRTMLVDEARLAARLHHPNVVAVLDVEELDGELSLVMDYVEGASLYDLIEKSQAAGRPLPPRIAMRVGLDACSGLHAAHTLSDEFGRPLGLVHRDVSPHNILVGLDGVSRLSDFGIAKHAEGAATSTGVLKGKLSYMAPEYLENTQLDARSDVFSLGVVVWEALAGQKLFRGKNELETFKKVVATVVPPLSSIAPWANERLDAVLFAALARDPDNRFQSADEFAISLEAHARYDDLIASPTEVGACVRELFGDALAERRADVRKRSAPIVIERPPHSSTALKSARQSDSPPEARPVTRGSSPPNPEEPTQVARSSAPDGLSAESSGLQRKAPRSSSPTPLPAERTSVPMGRQSAPNPVVAERPSASPGRQSAPNPVVAERTAISAGPQPAPAARVVEPPPPSFAEPAPVPASSGSLWKGALVLAVLLAAGGAIAFMATRSDGDARTPSAPSSTAGVTTRAVVAPVPQPIATAATPAATAATPTAHATSISVSELPDARPAPSGSAHHLTGHVPNKAHAPEAYQATTGVPLSAWAPAPPPPPAPAPEEPESPP